MKARTIRRIVGAGAIIAGAFLMWFSPEAPVGVLVMGAGIALELIGIAFERT